MPSRWLILLCFFSIELAAQQPHAWQLTDEEGLPSMTIYDLYQDKKGYIWIGSDGGVCRYNGKSIRTYSHPHQKGLAMDLLKEDTQGRIWCKNFNSQLFYIASDSLHLFPIPDSIGINAYFLYQHFNNKLWLNGSKGLYAYDFDQQEWQRVLSGNFLIASSLEIDNDHLLIMRGGNEIIRLSANKTSASLASYTPEKYHKIIKLKQSYLICNRSAVFLTPKTPSDTLPPPFLEDEILKLEVIGQQQEEFGVCTNNGLHLYTSTASNKVKKQAYLLPQNQVSSLLKDREGNYWLGTLNQGIFVFPTLAIQYYNQQNSTLPNQAINIITKGPPNQLLLGCGGGLVLQFDTPSKTIKKIYHTNRASNVTGITYSPTTQQLLFYNKGIYYYQNDKEQLQSPRFGGHHLALYQNDRLLFGGNQNMQTLALQPRFGAQLPIPTYSKMTMTLFKPSILNNHDTVYVYDIRQQRVNAVWVDQAVDNRFWVGYDDSLFYYDNFQAHPILNTKKQSINTLDLAQSPNGLLWVATVSDGIYGLRHDSVIYHLTQQDGLPSNSCKTIYAEDDAVYGGSSKGIFKVNLQTNEIWIYNRLDGLLTEEIRDLVVEGEQLWAATAKGLIALPKDYNPTSFTPPLLHFKNITVNKESLSIQTAPDLAYNQNNFVFSFEALSFRSQGKYTYAYRLLGLDSSWITTSGSNDQVRFQAIPAGQYTFEVKALNEDKVASKSIKYHFSIALPFWQRWWFQLLIYLLIAVIVTLIVNTRIAARRKQEAQRSQMGQLKMQALQSQMNPHFVFNAMSAIQSYWLQKKPKAAIAYHSKFAKLMRAIFEQSGQLAVPLKEEIDFLEVYLSLEQLRFDNKVEVIFDIEEGLVEKEIRIAPLLIQPIIENSFKHGFLHKEGKGLLNIIMRLEKEYLYVCVQDDGRGRAAALERKKQMPHKSKKRSSMAIIKERLELLAKLYSKDKDMQTLQITDLTDDNNQPLGTKVEMKIPLMNE